MYFYHHLGRSMKQFVERPDGLPVIYQQEVLIPLTTDQAEHDITDAVRLMTQYVGVGLWVVEPSAAGVQKLTEKLTCCSRAIFDTACLTLKDNTAVLFNGMPLRMIEKANANGLPYYVTPKGFLNFTESKLKVWGFAAIAANTAVKLLVDYVVPIGKNNADLQNLNK